MPLPPRLAPTPFGNRLFVTFFPRVFSFLPLSLFSPRCTRLRSKRKGVSFEYLTVVDNRNSYVEWRSEKKGKLWLERILVNFEDCDFGNKGGKVVIFFGVELKKLPVKKWRWSEYNFENLRIWNIIKSKFIEKVFKIDCKLREFRNFDWKDPKTWITWTQIYNANKIFTDLKLVVIDYLPTLFRRSEYF